MNNSYREDYLYHHGVMGMKWGVRRYQNPDGSLTEKGKKRYGENLDINDKSRENIAKIRLGEARRRYDIAKSNNSTNSNRLAMLKSREKQAKKMVRNAPRIDRGAKLVSKGRDIRTNNKIKKGLGVVSIANGALLLHMNTKISDMKKKGTITEAQANAARLLSLAGSTTVSSINAISKAHFSRQNRAIRSYYNTNTSIKNIGSEEYAAVVKRRKKENR